MVDRRAFVAGTALLAVAPACGLLPLALGLGAGAELRQALGTAVFFGMIGVTAFGLIFTPVFYVIARWVAALGPRRGKKHVPAPQPVG